MGLKCKPFLLLIPCRTNAGRHQRHRSRNRRAGADRPDFYGGDRVDLLFGVNMIGQRGVICGYRLAAEFGVPVYQRLNGPQLETD